MNLDGYYGAVLGAAVGDAVGISREFRDVASEKEIDHAMTLPGGGPHRAGPAAVSDDTELGICLSYGLLQPVSPTESPWDNIASMYCKWIRSFPFDSGATCSKAFSLDPDTPNIAHKMIRNSARVNMHSKANGAAMRCMPLVVFATAKNMDRKDFVDILTTDCLLSHPNPTCVCASVTYGVAMSHLLRHKNDICGAMQAAIQACKDNREVSEWLEISNTDCSKLDVSHQQGFVKWAIILAFWHLKKRSSYVDAIRHVVGLGSDSDTHGAIVGGLMGALHGAYAIPKEMLEKVIAYDPKKCGGHPRPDWLLPKHLPRLIENLTQTSIST